MRKATLLLASLSVLLFACNSGENTSNSDTPATDSSTQALSTTTTPIGNPMIPTDTANMMIMSYLNSINYTQNDSSVHSFIVNADVLRGYLSSPEGQTIHKLKVILAHTMDYINNGGKDQYAYYNSGELTIILAGYNDSGNYVLADGKAMDRVAPCPHMCPNVGTASADTLPRN